VIILGIGLGLILGLVARGSITRLIDVHLTWIGLIFVALALRVGTQLLIADGNSLAEALRLPLYAAAFLLLLAGLWPNRHQPGIAAVMVGAAANGLAIVVNGGFMPVYGPALTAATLGTGDLSIGFHVLLPIDFNAQFFLMAGPIADIIPIPIPYLSNVASIGDAFIAAGLGWFIFATMVRGTDEPEAAGISLGPGANAASESGIGLERPVVMGGGMGAGLSSPFGLGARIKGHPYVRLALDNRFAAYWLAQTISLFGDRFNQVALAVLVYAITNSPLATGLVFLSATLPNIVLGPIAGTFVDRWEHKRVMIAADLIRAVLVLAIPFAASQNVALVYPLVFAVTAVSMFFRPAKIAFLPRIVKEDDFMAASSATWTADNLADIVGYPLAGLFVAFLGGVSSQLALAFFADSATYVLSAILIATIAVAPITRTAAKATAGALRTFANEVAEGWRFLRTRAALFQNTLISVVAQMTVGVQLALTVVYARDTLDGSIIPYPQNYAAIDTAIGIGSLVGGLAVGLVSARFPKGRLVVGGFIVFGLMTVVMGLTSNVVLALSAASIVGVANLVFIIPTQTIFYEMTPNELMGRVLAIRSTLVFGAMTLAMGVASVVAEDVNAGLVIAGFGVLTVVAGVIGAFLPAVRDPETTVTHVEAAEPALQ
jgi:DHA3 family macrolide efflux protein-like MFS transporter